MSKWTQSAQVEGKVDKPLEPPQGAQQTSVPRWRFGNRVIRILSWIGGGEVRNLLLLIVLCSASWALIELTDEVLEGSTRSIDEHIVISLRTENDLSDPIGPLWVEEMARDATALGGVLIGMLTVVGSGLYLLLRTRVSEAGFLVVCVGSGLAISTLFKALIDRPRPELVAHGSHVYTASFPSGHSMMSALIYLTLAALLMRVEKRKMIKLLLLVLAVGTCLLVGLSRVYLGVHWPTDVLAGWTAGSIWALACYQIGLRTGVFSRSREPISSR